MTKHDFKIHTVETAPDASRRDLSSVQQKYGRVPNLFAVMAESPAALRAYLALSEIFQGNGLSAIEQQVVILAASVANGCDYCVVAHSRGARMAGVPDDTISAIEGRKPLPDGRHEALRRMVTALVEKRGWVPDQEVQAFLESGYSRSQLLDVMVGVSMKTLSNYINHIVDTPKG